MSHSRAFSDMEIVTIAAVAAAALGGIVVGLGRGQEEDHRTLPEGSKLTESLKRARESGRERVPSVSATRSVMPDRDIGSDLMQALRAVQSGGESVVKRASSVEVRPSERLSKVTRHVPRPQVPDRDSVVSQLRALGQDVIKTGRERLESTDWGELKDRGTARVSQLREDAGNKDDGPIDSVREMASKVGDEVKSIERRVAAAPEAAGAVGRGAAQEVQRRVSEPVSRAASSAGNATKESLAALAWLGAGSAIVYFGLLSDERREQVKSTLCSAIEQGRLLILDLQGYEPET
ncbi:hypothetical protein BH23CHL2_BH23CHL2_31610 [soil metagenome]